MPDLIYHAPPAVTFATNTFINVPPILQVDDTPIISVVQEGQSRIHHGDSHLPPGRHLSREGAPTRVHPTEAGRKAGVEDRQLPDL
jgi:hypothetical protein